MSRKSFAGKAGATLAAAAVLGALSFGTAPAALAAAEPPAAAPHAAAPGQAAGAAYGPYLLYNTVTGKCADIPDFGAGRINGPVNEYTCNGTSGDNQLFYWDYQGATSNGYNLYTVRNAKDNLCLDVHDYGAVEAGAKVSEYTCDGTANDNQQFWLLPRGGGGSWIVNLKSGLCLDVDGVRTGGNDARLTLYYCSDNDDHSWKLI
ncbi:RICIN domain-containing protein [Kitasatospora sp. NPDC090091]|uniref:RICIN domain-containing protein n=1 Tax=Kitasatospora sp. NPDC090091 TaxID=3364081 RepID=UPI003818D92C